MLLTALLNIYIEFTYNQPVQGPKYQIIYHNLCMKTTDYYK